VPVEALLRVTNGRHKFYELTLPGQKRRGQGYEK